MKRKAPKKLISALCLVMAMCMALQSVALAVELPHEELPALPISDSAPAETDPADNITETDSSAAVTEPVQPSEDASSGQAEPEEPGTPFEEPAEFTEERDILEQPTSLTSENTIALDDGSATSTGNGWVQAVDKNGNPVTNEDGTPSLTFYYREAAASSAQLAQDKVLYIPAVDCTISDKSYSFNAGYYYFDENGILALSAATAEEHPSYQGKPEAVALTNGKYIITAVDSKYSGKLLDVTTTYTATAAGVQVSSTEAPYAGKYAGDGFWYYDGVIYTGYWTTANNLVYYIDNGVVTGRLSGKMDTSASLVNSDMSLTDSNGLWYYDGKIYTGYWCTASAAYEIKDGVVTGRLTGKMSTSTSLVNSDMSLTKGNGLWYYDGKVYTGYWTTASAVYYIKNGSVVGPLSGVMSTSVNNVTTSLTLTKGDGKVYKNGALFTGVYNLYYYSKGVQTTNYRGWQTFSSTGASSTKSSDSTYYFDSNGKCLTGWQILTGPDDTTYKYYFLSNGTLCKNIFEQFSSYKQSKTFVIKVYYSRSSTNTATIFATDSSGYYIPCKSFTVGTAKDASNFHPGTYKLTSRTTWLDLTSYQYLWATNIKGSTAWFHSESYSSQNHNALVASQYNGLGTNQSQYCIRMQVVNCKLIYDIYSQVSSVILVKSTSKGPFGRMSISDNIDYTGTISAKHDPTDPS